MHIYIYIYMFIYVVILPPATSAHVKQLFHIVLQQSLR